MRLRMLHVAREAPDPRVGHAPFVAALEVLGELTILTDGDGLTTEQIADEVRRCVIYISSWGSVALPASLAGDRGSLEYVCHVNGTVRQVVPASLIEAGLPVTNWGDALAGDIAEGAVTIQGSLAIEGNTLSLEQVSRIAEGKKVVGPLRDIQEVRNAIVAYERSGRWRFRQEKDLLAAHATMMRGLVDDPGKYRHGSVEIQKGSSVIFVAPPSENVPFLMKDLFAWLHKTREHPLVTSSVFHYELEVIHPFSDGNGRIGRLWQSMILTSWKPVFAMAPIESIVSHSQKRYHSANNRSNRAGASTDFVEFMLGAVRTALATLSGTEQVTEQVRSLLKVMGTGAYSTRELMNKLGLAHRPTFLSSYLRPALALPLVEMIDPESPRSPKQRYRKSRRSRNTRTGPA